MISFNAERHAQITSLMGNNTTKNSREKFEIDELGYDHSFDISNVSYFVEMSSSGIEVCKDEDFLAMEN